MAREQLILNSFGLRAIKPLVYRTATGPGLSQNASDFEEIEVDSNTRMDTGADDQKVLSVLGTPVFADVTLSYEAAGLYLNMSTVLIEVSQTKNIVTTSVQGRNGTIKEYISDGDYLISLRGILVSETSDAYPVNQVQEFIDLMKVQSDLPIVSPFLQLFEIYNIVITDYRLPQVVGYQNQQPFEINCISDEPIELIEIDV